MPPSLSGPAGASKARNCSSGGGGRNFRASTDSGNIRRSGRLSALSVFHRLRELPQSCVVKFAAIISAAVFRFKSSSISSTIGFQSNISIFSVSGHFDFVCSRDLAKPMAYSNFMAAWPSKRLKWHIPRREETASKRRPALEVREN